MHVEWNGSAAMGLKWETRGRSELAAGRPAPRRSQPTVAYCSVILLAGTFTEVVQRFLNWNEQSKGAKVVKSACSLLVLLVGDWPIYTAP
jgi:hypothetical protein